MVAIAAGTPVNSGNPPVYLDAGAAISVTGPAGSRAIQKVPLPLTILYSGNFGNATPGNYLDPGHYTVTGPGGPDIGPFTASVDVPSSPFTWSNLADAAFAERAKG